MQLKTLYLPFLFLAFLSSQITGQSSSNGTSKLISGQYKEERLSTLFEDITKQSGFLFSSSDLDLTTRISMDLHEASINDAIQLLSTKLEREIVLKGNYIIIKSSKKRQPKELQLFGIIKDQHTGLPINEATVFIKDSKQMSNTDEFGRYKLIIPNKNKSVKIQINKEEYLDTIVVFIADKDRELAINLHRVPKAKIDDLKPLTKIESAILFDNNTLPLNHSIWDKIEADNAQIKNIKDTLFSPLSLSLIPPLSTNKLLSFNTKNSIAINIIGGNSKGIDYLELGGVYNLDYGDVQYVQAAGVGNMVYGTTRGVQMAGVYNLVKGDLNGVQSAGVGNITTNIKGVQLAGVFNSNLTKIEGVQASGVYQKSDTIHGIQMTGIYNKAQQVKGLQVSGILNQADTLQGLQIGLINLSKNSDNGLSIGLLNIVKDGYRKVEVSYDDKGFAGLAGRSGTKKFHTYLKAGIKADTMDDKLIQMRFGIGSSIPISTKFNIELDMSSGSINQWNDKAFNFNYNSHSQLLVGVSYQPFKHLQVRTALTVNHVFYNKNESIASSIDELIKETVYKYESDTKVQKVWLGYQVSILF